MERRDNKNISKNAGGARSQQTPAYDQRHKVGIDLCNVPRCDWILSQLLRTGDVVSMRFSFAFFGVSLLLSGFLHNLMVWFLLCHRFLDTLGFTKVCSQVLEC